MKFPKCLCYPLLTFSQHVRPLLLVDEDDDRGVDASIEDLDELVPLVVLLAHVDHLLCPLDGPAHGADVHHHGPPQVVPGQPLHRRGHSGREHHLEEEQVLFKISRDIIQQTNIKKGGLS